MKENDTITSVEDCTIPTLSSIAPMFNVVFSKHGEEIGRLDFSGPTMIFTGKADESALVFFGYIAGHFYQRLEAEREAGRNEQKQTP